MPMFVPFLVPPTMLLTQPTSFSLTRHLGTTRRNAEICGCMLLLIFEATRRLHFITSTSPATGIAVTSEENRVRSKWIKVRVPFFLVKVGHRWFVVQIELSVWLINAGLLLIQANNSIRYLSCGYLRNFIAELGSWVIADVDFSAFPSFVSVLENQSFALRSIGKELLQAKLSVYTEKHLMTSGLRLKYRHSADRRRTGCGSPADEQTIVCGSSADQISARPK
ncbi:hypothetical protein DFH09DRAFT_1446159 [Mycena vulgaris]|nr:hypothetical protein DFH09DRAFT_1446159 [Mycena vulgaris]